jgi:hypothetical protein
MEETGALFNLYLRILLYFSGDNHGSIEKKKPNKTVRRRNVKKDKPI